jgi:hypothetical protein
MRYRYQAEKTSIRSKKREIGSNNNEGGRIARKLGKATNLKPFECPVSHTNNPKKAEANTPRELATEEYVTTVSAFLNLSVGSCVPLRIRTKFNTAALDSHLINIQRTIKTMTISNTSEGSLCSF